MWPDVALPEVLKSVCVCVSGMKTHTGNITSNNTLSQLERFNQNKKKHFPDTFYVKEHDITSRCLCVWIR